MPMMKMSTISTEDNSFYSREMKGSSRKSQMYSFHLVHHVIFNYCPSLPSSFALAVKFSSSSIIRLFLFLYIFSMCNHKACCSATSFLVVSLC